MMRFFSAPHVILLVVCAMLCMACSDDDEKVNLYVYDGVENELPTYTGLPIVDIRTEDGLALYDKETWKKATITFYGNGQYEDFTDEVYIKGRGNSTFKKPKTPFNLKFDNKRSWLGMKKSKHWAFLANYFDPTLMRNDLTFHLGKLANHIEWTPSGEFVELMFNGHHGGNYYVTERVKVENGRLNLKEIKDEDARIANGIANAIDNLLMSGNYKDMPYSLNSYNWIQDPEDQSYIFCVYMGEYNTKNGDDSLSEEEYNKIQELVNKAFENLTPLDGESSYMEGEEG